MTRLKAFIHLVAVVAGERIRREKLPLRELADALFRAVVEEIGRTHHLALAVLHSAMEVMPLVTQALEAEILGSDAHLW